MLAGMEDSSVLFNLNEIMKLERERVTAEEAAVRAAAAHAKAEREARAREQREQAAREHAAREHAAAERERLSREAVRAEENARAAQLLRVRLEAEAQQRLADQQLDLKRTAQLYELAESERKKRSSWLIAGALVALCVASGAAYSYVLEPALRAAGERSAALDLLTADAAAQTAALARQVEDLRAAQARTAAEQLKPTASPTPTQTSSTAKQPRPRPQPAIKPVVKPDTSLDALCKGSDDPLCGLDSPSSSKRKR
jgi:hypothetical protein